MVFYMKKNIFVFLLILMIGIIISSLFLNYKNDFEYISVDSSEYIKNDRGVFIFDNHFNEDLDLDDYFKIVKIEEDAVIDLNCERPNLAGVGTFFPANSVSEIEIVWNYYYGELEPGRYIITFYFNDKQYNASAEFFIK